MHALRALIIMNLQAAWRRRWLGVMIAWLVCCLGWAGSYAIPNQFESDARLFVDADAILTPLLRGIAAESSPTTQLEILQRTLLSKPNLEKLISKTGLDLTVTSQIDHERLISRLSTQIKVTPQTKNLFTISYHDPSPRMAHDVVQSLLTIFIEQATGSNRIDMENAKRFLVQQAASYEAQLRAAEKRRADFRVKYMEILPNDLNPNVGALEASRTAVTAMSGALQDAIHHRDSIRDELNNTPQMLVAESGVFPGYPSLPPPKTKLEEAQDALQSLLVRYTDEHPDVIAQRKLVDFLRENPENGPKKGRKTDTAVNTTPKRSVPNPVYDQLKIKLVDADSQVSSMQRQFNEAQKTKERLELTSREQPGLFADYMNMDRDYAVLKKNYEDLLSRLQSANIAQAADTQADKIKLQIIDPPEVARLPITPNRPLMITGVFFVGISVSLGIVLLLSQMDKSFHTVDDLRSLGLPVVGGLSNLHDLPSFRNTIMKTMRFSVAIGVLFVVYGGLMAHILRIGAI